MLLYVSLHSLALSVMPHLIWGQVIYVNEGFHAKYILLSLLTR